MSATLLLSREDLQQVLDPAAVVEVVAEGFRAYSAGHARSPARIHLEIPDRDDVLLVMPCAVSGQEVLGTKVAAVYRGNPALGLPTVTSLYLLSDYRTGVPLAVMDGTYLTAIRTAAASAVATRALARADSSVLAIFGTGTLAEFHTLVLPWATQLRRALVVGRTSEQAQAFCARLDSCSSMSLEAAASIEQVLSVADVIVTATTAREPLFDGRLVRPGTHVNAVGAFTPTTRELDGALLARATVVADTLAGVKAEAGDILLAVGDGAIADDHVRAEVGDVLLNRHSGRTGEGEITIYKSVGAAFQDAVTARLAFDRALYRGLGGRYTFS